MTLPADNEHECKRCGHKWASFAFIDLCPVCAKSDKDRAAFGGKSIGRHYDPAGRWNPRKKRRKGVDHG